METEYFQLNPNEIYKIDGIEIMGKDATQDQAKIIFAQEESEMWAEYAKSMDEYHGHETKIKSEYKKKLNGLINVAGLFRHLNENDHWMPEEIVDIIITGEKKNGYSSQCARIYDDKHKLLYLRCSENEIRGIDHYYVWQQSTSMEGDSYSGHLLFPLKDGRYFKVSYSC